MTSERPTVVHVAIRFQSISSLYYNNTKNYEILEGIFRINPNVYNIISVRVEEKKKKERSPGRPRTKQWGDNGKEKKKTNRRKLKTEDCVSEKMKKT